MHWSLAMPTAWQQGCRRRPGCWRVWATAAEQQLGADESELVLWRELRSATREAWRQNAINGALISERLLANQNALAAISPPGRCLYGRHGRSVSGWDSRELGAA